MTEGQHNASWNVAARHGTMLVDREGERIGKLQDVYVDVENDEPRFATVKEGLIGRYLTFVPLSGITVGPDDLQVVVTKEQVQSAPQIEQHGRLPRSPWNSVTAIRVRSSHSDCDRGLLGRGRGGLVKMESSLDRELR